MINFISDQCLVRARMENTTETSGTHAHMTLARFLTGNGKPSDRDRAVDFASEATSFGPFHLPEPRDEMKRERHRARNIVEDEMKRERHRARNIVDDRCHSYESQQLTAPTRKMAFAYESRHSLSCAASPSPRRAGSGDGNGAAAIQV